MSLALIDKDICFEGSGLKVLKGAESLKQRLLNKISMFKAEWFLLPDEGIDWLSLLDKKYISDREVRLELESIFSADEKVIKTNYIDIAFDNETRELLISFSVDSSYGEIGVTL